MPKKLDMLHLNVRRKSCTTVSSSTIRWIQNQIKGNSFVGPIACTKTNKKEFLPIIIYRNIYRIGLWTSSLIWVRAVTHVLTILFILACVLQFINLLNSLNDMEALIECFSILSFFGMGLFKLTALKFTMKHLKSIMKLSKTIYDKQNTIKTMITDYDREDEQQNRSEVEKFTKEMNLIVTCIPKLYTTTCIVFLMAPFLEYIILMMSGNKVKLPHVLPIWSSYDDSFYVYAALVFTELASSIFCVGIHIAFDVICICVMIFIVSQFSIMQVKVNEIGGRGRQCLLSETRDRRTQARIKACHKQHRVLIKLCKYLDVILRPIMGLYFTIATLTLCATAVQFSAKSSRLQFFKMTQYLGATLTQLYLFCRFGDNVYQKSNLSLLHVSWWAMRPRVCKDLLILGYGLRKAQVLRAGLFYTINLRSFLSIVQTAYSFYALLNKVKE